MNETTEEYYDRIISLFYKLRDERNATIKALSRIEDPPRYMVSALDRMDVIYRDVEAAVATMSMHQLGVNDE